MAINVSSLAPYTATVGLAVGSDTPNATLTAIVDNVGTNPPSFFVNWRNGG
jgi:hypothetical protein